jgi:hypothetical protein
MGLVDVTSESMAFTQELLFFGWDWGSHSAAGDYTFLDCGFHI